MTNRFDAVNLSRLPFPPVVEPLDYETIRAGNVAKLKELLLSYGFDWDMDAIEADPGTAITESSAYRELLVRARVNDAARAIMLAYALGGDLDNLAALYKVARMEGETDAQLRERTQVAPEALSVAGPAGAYVFHTRSVSAEIVDVGVYSPKPGAVHVVPLVATGNGVPSEALMTAIRDRLNADNIRPLTDAVTVRKPKPIPVTINAELLIPAGPDPAVVLASAMSALTAYLASRRRIGYSIYRSGLIAALAAGSVDRVTLASPAEDVAINVDQVAAVSVGAITVRRP